MANQVRYTGSIKRIAGCIGTLVETRLRAVGADDTALVSFPQLPSPVRHWNLSPRDLEQVA